MRYKGRLSETMSRLNLGFIVFETVTKEDGTPSVLGTSEDIFVHQDDCNGQLVPGVEVIFDVEPDSRRNGHSLRAINVQVLSRERELVLVGADGKSVAINDPRSLYVPPTERQQAAMPVAAEDVAAVIRNEPMPLMARGEEAQGAIITKDSILMRAFPQLYNLSRNTNSNFVDESFDRVIAESIANHQSIGLQSQADSMERQASVFKAQRTVLENAEDLLHTGSVLPIQYLPDLFMAVPVWYFWADQALTKESKDMSQAEDPEVNDTLRYFCDLFPNDRWSDTFLMFNRRIRTLADYRGDIIPSHIIERMRSMSQHFDFLTIMTPYHDVAGKDWEDLEWLRSIDPYVIGFIKGIPHMFVLGRFSDSGIFPLHSELVAGTIDFLKKNKPKLKGFDVVQNPYWYLPESGRNSVSNLGTRLISRANELLASFEAGYLFDWLRGSDQKVSTKT